MKECINALGGEFDRVHLDICVLAWSANQVWRTSGVIHYGHELHLEL